MKSAPTPEQIAKLPVWAREHIKSLQRERDVSVRELNEYCDSSTPSPFYTESCVCTGEANGPTNKVRFIQANVIQVEWMGVWLSVSAHGYSNYSQGIRLQWGSKDRHLDMAMIPESHQCVRIVSREDMYPKQKQCKTETATPSS